MGSNRESLVREATARPLNHLHHNNWKQLSSMQIAPRFLSGKNMFENNQEMDLYSLSENKYIKFWTDWKQKGKLMERRRQ